jgi:hypothetical protein
MTVLDKLLPNILTELHLNVKILFIMMTIQYFQKLSRVRLISISIASVLIIAGGVFALHTTQQPTIVSTNTAAMHQSTQKPTTVATSTTTSPADTSTTAGTPSSTSSKTTSKTSNSTSATTYSASNPNNSTALSVATVAPITPSSYTPTPSFNLSLHADQGYATTYPTIPDYAYFNIPYSLSYDPGFGVITSAIPGCNFVSGPSLVNIWCNVGEKGSVLSIQYDNDTVAGHYVVQMSYTMNGVTRTDVASFDVQ